MYLDKISAEALTKELVHDNVDVNDLNLAKKAHREAFLSALKTHPRLLQKVSAENAKHLIGFALKEDFGYFTCLKQEQYTEDFVQFYLQNRLEADGLDESKNLLAQKSLDDKLVLHYIYATPEGEELFFFDQKLGVPLSLKSSFKATLKLRKSVTFIKKLDIETAQLGARRIHTALTDLLGNLYKNFLSNFIKDKKVGYYELCSSIAELEQGLEKELNKGLDDYGIEITSVTMKKLAIPQDIQHKIEDQSFQIRQRRAEVEADAEFAKKSLENYEAKLAMESKYPEANHSLTEYEKDLALKRYLIKKGRYQEDEVDHSIELKQKADVKDDTISKNDVVPEITPKINVFKATFFGLLTWCILIAFIVMIAGSVGVGCIIFACISAIFGTVAAFTTEKFKTPKVELDDEGGNNDVGNE